MDASSTITVQDPYTLTTTTTNHKPTPLQHHDTRPEASLPIFPPSARDEIQRKSRCAFNMGNTTSTVLDNIVQGSNCRLPVIAPPLPFPGYAAAN